MNFFTLQSRLTKYRVRTHDEVKERLMEIGEEFGYFVIDEYEVPDLVTEGRVSRIDVVWRSSGRIAVAFEVRMKTRDLDIPTSEKDRKKLERLEAGEKFLVNASRKTGKTYVFQMGEEGEWL